MLGVLFFMHDKLLPLGEPFAAWNDSRMRDRACCHVVCPLIASPLLVAGRVGGFTRRKMILPMALRSSQSQR
jgi:hypothetical protein